VIIPTVFTGVKALLRTVFDELNALQVRRLRRARLSIYDLQLPRHWLNECGCGALTEIISQSISLLIVFALLDAS